MKFYRIQGESGWYSWEDLHNLYGYTETPSLSLQYKSAASETWGEYAASGYSDNAFEDLAACSYFVSGEPGWGGLNGLATVLHLYPAVCSDGPNVTNGVVSSPTATYDFNGETFYLIRDDVAHGWIAGADLSSYGWEIEDDTQYELLFFDTTTSKVTYGVESLNELVFVEAGYFTIDDGADVVFVEQSQFPVVCTYTENIASQSVAPDAGFATGLPYYDSKVYSVQTSDGVNVTRSGWEAGEEPDTPNLYATNKTSSTITVTSCTVHFIDSADASLVTVYDSNDAPCDAFQYSLSGVPWWYVLDGVHDAWVDDLSSIGYHLPTPTTQRAWLTTSGPHSDKYLNTGTEYSVVDSHDTHIPYDSTKTYILVGVYKINGTQVQGSFSLVSGGDGYGNTILKIVNNSTRTEVGYLDYYTT